MVNICVLDYGSGNVKSVFQAFQDVTTNVKISNSVVDMKNASHLVLPGVGSFSTAMRKIRSELDVPELLLQLDSGKPFLGICVGMQVLAEIGLEFGENEGLNIFAETKVQSLSSFARVPHVGWNSITYDNYNPIVRDIPSGSDFYFVHSFGFLSEHKDSREVAITTYGTDFVSIMNFGNIYGVQFHPEKSQKYGRQLIKNFVFIE